MNDKIEIAICEACGIKYLRYKKNLSGKHRPKMNNPRPSNSKTCCKECAKEWVVKKKRLENKIRARKYRKNGIHKKN